MIDYNTVEYVSSYYLFKVLDGINRVCCRGASCYSLLCWHLGGLLLQPAVLAAGVEVVRRWWCELMSHCPGLRDFFSGSTCGHLYLEVRFFSGGTCGHLY